jgi:ferredoxin
MAYSNVILNDMLQSVCAHCRKFEYEELKPVEYDVSATTKKTVDMDLFIASRRLPTPVIHLIRCDGCQRCYYCSEECKEEHYRSVHRLECEFFNKVRILEEMTPDIGQMDLDWNPSHERTLLRHLIRIMTKRYEEKCIGSLSANSVSIRPTDVGDLLNMAPRSANYQDDVINLIFKSKMCEEHMRVAAEAKEILPIQYHPSDESEMAQVLSRIDCNKFGLFGRRGEVLGSALHPSASFVNHSCLPNAFSHIVDHKLFLYTLYPVEVGEELNIGYIEPEIPLKERRAQLKDTYGFDCVCRRCTKESFKDSPPKLLYDDFFTTHLNCPLCKKGLLMVADEEDIKTGLEDAAKDPTKFSSLIPEPIPGISSYRSCNGCHKLQIRPLIPSVAEWKKTWVNTEPSNSKSRRR